jgi:hypothetical protein
MRIKLSQSDWQRIGEEMGWMKTAMDSDESDYEPEHGFNYFLFAKDGALVRKGYFISTESEVYPHLEFSVKGEPCGREDKVKSLGNQINDKSNSDEEYKFEVLNSDGVVCGYVTANRQLHPLLTNPAFQNRRNSR